MQKIYAHIVVLVAQCHPSMRRPRYLICVQLLRREIKGLFQGGLYQLQDKIRRLYDRGFSRSRDLSLITEAANFWEFHRRCLFLARIVDVEGRSFEGMAGVLRSQPRRASSEGAAERRTVNRALLRYTEITECSRRRARSARASISSTWVVRIVSVTGYRDPEEKYWKISRKYYILI